MLGLVETVENLAEKSRETIPATPIDVIRDGLLCCGTCGEPKETVVEVGGKSIVARCLCRCGVEAREKARADELRKQQEESRKDWMRGFEAFTFDADNGKNPTMAFARKYMERWDSILAERLSFTLSGGVGCGKTYAAAAIANAVLDKGYRVWMVTAPALVELMGFETCERTMNRLKVFELVVIDDLGAERGTEYAKQKIFEAIDTRKNAGLPTIITTNLDMERDDPDLSYQRILSRVNGFAPQFRCRGEDLRAGDGKERRSLLREMLGGGS